MEDNNKNQGLQGQNSEQPLNQFNTNQNNTERTYWENGDTSQNLIPPQNTPTQENSSQFQQFYQQQMGDNFNAEQSTKVPLTQPKKKITKKLIAAFIVLALLISLSATAFAFQDTLLNTYAMMTKSPEEYYAYIEKKAIEDSVDKLVPYLDLYSKNMEGAYKASVDISYDRETVNSLLQSTVGMRMEDLESSLGISLDSIGMDATIATKDGAVYDSIGISLNQIDLITIEILMDTLKQEMLMRFPELSSAYIKESYATEEVDMNMYYALLEKLTSEKTADFMKRYGNIVTDNMNNVVLSKNEKLTVDKLTVNSNKLTVTIDNESAYKIILAILDEAKEDEYLYEFLPLFEITEEEFMTAIEEAKDSLKEAYESDNAVDGSIEMDVYVNSRGEIIGREITAIEDGQSMGSIGYANVSNDDYNEFNFSIKDEKGDAILSGNGNQTKEGDTYGGEVAIEITDSSLELPTNISLNIEYDDVKTVTIDDHIYQYGTYTISSPQAMGIQVVIENDVENDVQKSIVNVQMGVSTLFTIATETEYLKDFTFPTISDNDEVYTDYDSYLSSIDIEAFITELSNKLGINLEDLINSFMLY